MTSSQTPAEKRKRSKRTSSVIWALLSFIVMAAVTLLGLVTATFFLGRILPSDPVLAIIGDSASASAVAQARAQYGFDLPLWQQYLNYLGQALKGDFGKSLFSNNPVMQDIARFFPATVELATFGTIIGVLFGLPMGVLAAVKRDSIWDQIIRVVALLGYSIPIFWLGQMALVLLYLNNWTGSPGRIDVAYEFSFSSPTNFFIFDAFIQREWAILRDLLSHIMLPAVLLGYFSMAYISRMTRSFMLNELGQEYIVAARAKGVSETKIIWGHALRNAAVPLVTVIALSYATLLEGSVLTERIFNWPGIGSYLTNALFNNDMNAVLGATIVVGAVFILVNLFSDFLYRVFDPRSRS